MSMVRELRGSASIAVEFAAEMRELICCHEELIGSMAGAFALPEFVLRPFSS